MPQHCNVICDFDGTISKGDVTDALLEAFALPAWRLIEAEWTAGRIGSLECMARQVDLLQCNRADLDAFLQTIEIDRRFSEFAAYCAEFDMPIVILSDGIDYAIHAILRRHHLDFLPVLANKLISTGNDRWRLTFPHRSTTCRMAAGTCKCGVLARLARNGLPNVLIGDGASDFCAARAADFTFAKDRLLEFCLDEHLPHCAFEDFGQVLAMIQNIGRVLPAELPAAL